MSRRRYAKSIMKVSESITKKGKLKGKNKSETKLLVGICTHHRMNKKGKLVATTFNNGDYCVCTLCRKQFPGTFYDNNSIKKIVNDFEEMNNQAKFMAVATNAGDNMIDYFTQEGAILTTYKKNAKKLRNVAQKQGAVKEKKKKRNNGSDMYGSWGQRR